MWDKVSQFMVTDGRFSVYLVAFCSGGLFLATTHFSLSVFTK